MVYYLLGPVSDVVHALHPQHLILRFVRFCNALCYCHLINQSKEHLPRLIVQFGEITVQLAGSQQFRIHHLSMLPENPKAPLPPNPDWALFFRRYGQAWEITAPVQLVPQAILFIVDLLFHCLTLPFIIMTFLALRPFCLLCLSCLGDQIVDLFTSEHLPQQRIVPVLYSQG